MLKTIALVLLSLCATVKVSYILAYGKFWAFNIFFV